jgi:hypothetical protein
MLVPFTLPFTSLQIASYNKPTLVTEFGCNDVTGQHLTPAGVHAGIWAPWFAGSAGAGAGWCVLQQQQQQQQQWAAS